jgi:predicted DCC family thiol-disulfide oxidoreductase YuxK
LYDGDCGFCRRWVARWKQITGGRDAATPYQEAAARHPEIPIEEFRRAIQYIDEGGQRWSGAQAIFESLKPIRGYGWLAWAYGRVPLFAPASDWVYREVAGHRKTATWMTRMLWGASLDLPRYETSVWLFRRALAVLFLIAFLSFGVQVRGLIGSQGILPAGSYLEAVRNEVGASWFTDAPTLFWWWHGDGALQAACWMGAALAAICAAGIFQRTIFAALFVLYLSLVTAGQIFMGYQWDFLLLETGFLAIFLTPSLPRVWLCQWLLFRLMFESGCVKLLSHDRTWANLTALSYHYETQPLPTPLAWYAEQLPMWVQKASTVSVFAIELAAPLLIFGPRRLKQIAAAAFVSLQMLIMLTGNYTCFNLLAMTLCLTLLDDCFWGGFLARFRRGTIAAGSRASRILSAALLGFVLAAGGTQLAVMFSAPVPGAAKGLVETLAPFGIINSYGLFATMTTVRIEIEVQGSNDGENWQTYTFPYKPGDPARAPRWVAPHQPRLDWQMWFAALGNYRENPWFGNFMVRLLSASPDVLRLLERDPFHGLRPKYVQAIAWEYHFSDISSRERDHIWWRRERKGAYFPPASLRKP